MMLSIPVLDADAVARVRAIIEVGDWVDGNVTSGPQSALAKDNAQLAEECAAARDAGALILEALGRTPEFVAAALPAKIFPPLFNRYAGGQAFGAHIDNAIRLRRGTDLMVRSDLSATLFLVEPDTYEGGGLVIEGLLGAAPVKLPAGHLLLYPASTVHRVEPVTRGTRLASFFWIQSMVREDAARGHLLDLDRSVQHLAAERGQDDATVIRLTGLYHNLLRRWAAI